MPRTELNPITVIFWTLVGGVMGCALLTAYIASIFWLCRAVWNLIV